MTQPEQEKQDLNVAIFWRQEAKKLKYEWFGQVWTSDEDNKTQEELKATLKRLLSPNEILSHDTILKVHMEIFILYTGQLSHHFFLTSDQPWAEYSGPKLQPGVDFLDHDFLQS